MWILFFRWLATLVDLVLFFLLFFIVLMLYLIDRKEKFTYPILALTLGLIRPDGVIIGVFIVLITFLANKNNIKNYN